MAQTAGCRTAHSYNHNGSKADYVTAPNGERSMFGLRLYQEISSVSGQEQFVGRQRQEFFEFFSRYQLQQELRCGTKIGTVA